MKKLLVSLIAGIIILSASCKKRMVPILETSPVTGITINTAVSGGTITDNGGANIIESGICWNTSPEPIAGDNKVITTGSNSFTGNMTNLLPNTQYYVRAYATNEAGTGYGNDIAFKTIGDKPLVAPVAATNITINSATLNGTVNPNFLASSVSFEYGISFDYGSLVSLSDQISADENSHNVTINITGLTPGTTYYFRIKATNIIGTSLSTNLSFKTLGNVPSVTTLPVSDPAQNSVMLSALVNPNYLTTQVSFEWGTTSGYGNMLTALQNSLTGSNNTNILLTLSGLQKGTIYHYRVKAVNSLGTSYGMDVQFTTLSEPVLNTLYISTGISSAVCGGNITNDFGTDITDKGICWGQYPGPLVFQNNKIVYTGTEKKFNLNINGLDPNSTYYVRAYATNKIGTSYGEEMIIKTYTGTISDNEGNTYLTVTINNQVWMAENLKSKKFLNGDPIGTTTDDLHNVFNPEYQWAYDNNENNVSTYGRLYTWFAVKDSRKICPTGWHVPAFSEVYAMSTSLGGYLVNGGLLKEAGINHWESPNNGATNSTGFTGLPGGYRSDYGTFLIWKQFGGWWTSTEDPSYPDYAYSISLHGSSYVSGIGSSSTKKYGLSVRCMKD
jgi:uncharacterized protein (TIGR02145 family)